MKKYILGFIILLVIILYVFSNVANFNTKEKLDGQNNFLPLGDSYTIGEGLPPQDTWPVLLVEKLREEGIKIVLVANPSVTGWTTQDVIDKELPIYESSDPDFATLLIGVNDWVQGIDEATFQKNLKQIIDRMQNGLPNKQNMILITIPDFSKTPTGKRYDPKGKATEGIARFNSIIEKEGASRNIPVVDIYPITQKMENDSSLVNPDGLHPSRKEYALWTDEIFPIALKMLKNQKK